MLIEDNHGSLLRPWLSSHQVFQGANRYRIRERFSSAGNSSATPETKLSNMLFETSSSSYFSQDRYLNIIRSLYEYYPGRVATECIGDPYNSSTRGIVLEGSRLLQD